MPEPFRLIVPPPLATEKLLLVQSGKLAIALSVNKVQEVLLRVAVISHNNKSVTKYKDTYIPVVLGQSACPPIPETTLVLMQTQVLKSGLVAIACSTMPKLAEISPQEWLTAEPLPRLWQSDGRAYKFGDVIYKYATDIVKK